MQAMQSITALVQDDPYMRMTPQQRIAERKQRRQNFFGLRPVPVAPTIKPIVGVDPEIRRWIDANKESFAKPNYRVMWFSDLIVRSMKAIHPNPKPVHPRVEDIQRIIAKFYGLTLAELLSQRRTHDVVRPRQIGFYHCKKKTRKSLPEIGRRFGDRDHTTILHGIRKIEELIQRDARFAGEVDAIGALIDKGLS